MRITESQLRRIIREEVRRAVLNEAAYTALPRDRAIEMSVNMVDKAEHDPDETEREETLNKLRQFLSSNNLLGNKEEQKNEIIQLVKDKKFKNAIEKIRNY